MPHTLQQHIVVEGVGLQTGRPARVELRPAEAGRGRVFLAYGVEIPALVEYVVGTERRTTLGREGVVVNTVEHLLAACLLTGLDDAEFLVEGPELPALDGSAQPWVDAILSAGLQPTQGEIPCISIVDACWVQEGGSQFFLLPGSEWSVYAAIAIPDTFITGMVAGGRLQDAAAREQMARARTYGLESEVQALIARGLALGGSLDNAVIVKSDGYVNTDVRPNEPAWHKALDLLGDLALLGRHIQGTVLAVRAGHASHVALVRRLQAAGTQFPAGSDGE